LASLIDAARQSIWTSASISILFYLLGARVRWRPTAFAVEGSFAAVALDVHFHDRGVVHEAVDGRQRHSLIGEDATPFAEWLIGRDEQRSPLVTCGNKLEQHAGLRLILGDIGDIVKDQEVVAIELSDCAFQG
jgi:hypothetical protein